MTELLSSSLMDCEFPAIDIPSVAEALRVMRFEISHASGFLLNMRKALVSLEETIRNSNYVDVSVSNHEVIALKQSVQNLECSLEVAISEIQGKTSSLETAMERKIIIPGTLSTADDISVAFDIAVDNPQNKVNWPLAEMVLERFSFLWAEELSTVDFVIENSVFGKEVWKANRFYSNMVELLEGADRWRVRKSLEILSKLVDMDGDCDLSLSNGFFESLASIILQPEQAIFVDKERVWIHLIAKNQNKTIDQGISRLINSFLYSRKEEIKIVGNVMNIIYISTYKRNGIRNCIHLSQAESIPKALVSILVNGIEHSSIIFACFAVLQSLFKSLNKSNDFDDLYSSFEDCGICEALMTIMKVYKNDNDIIRDVLWIIHCVVDNGEPYIVEAGLLKALVEAFDNNKRINNNCVKYLPNHLKDLKKIVIILNEWDPKLYRELRSMGMPSSRSLLTR
jgi:hypothetical protein